MCCCVAIAFLKQAATGEQFPVDQLKELNKQRARKAELDELLKREVEEILRLRQVITLSKLFAMYVCMCVCVCACVCVCTCVCVCVCKCMCVVLERYVSQHVHTSLLHSQELGQNYYKCLQEITNIQSVVLDQELANWKRTQRLCGQEDTPNKKEVLDQLQQWCEQLADLLWRNRMQIMQVRMLISALF